MDKRYQVFVSSTFLDLQRERQEVIQALLELDCIPAGMEIFPASDEGQWELIKRVIDDCDYYVVVVGGRYGSLDSEGISYTEREYDYAVGCGLPVLGFVHGKPEEIPVGKTEIDPEAREKLEKFKNKVQSRMCRSWTTAEELGGAVSRSLVQTIKRNPREGWIKARYATSAETLNVLRQQIDQLERQLKEVRNTPPSTAQGLAQGAEKFKLRYAITTLVYEEHSLEVSWDFIIATLGPIMFHEASDAQIHQCLVYMIFEQRTINRRHMIKIVDGDLQTVKVQLMALGIIQKSSHKRSARDKETYWSLTPYGEHYTVSLKAIPSQDSVAAS